MTIRITFRYALLVFALVFVVPGCKKAKLNTETDDSQPPSGNPTGTTTGTNGGNSTLGGAKNAADRLALKNDMQDFARAYNTYAQGNGAPGSMAGLPGFEQLKIAKAVKAGDIIVLWLTDPTKGGVEASNTVIAYEKDVPTKGGIVVTLDQSARTVTVEEFKKLVKPGQ